MFLAAFFHGIRFVQLKNEMMTQANWIIENLHCSLHLIRSKYINK